MRVRSTGLAAAVLGVALAVVGPLAGTAFAHERRTVGPVQMVVGWLNEPAYAGFLNAVQLRLSDDAGPITDAGDAVKVEITFGDQKMGPVALAPAFGSPGEYRANLIPSRAGAYTFRFVGTVRGQQLDQKFTSSPTTFDSAKDPAEAQFPIKDPTPAELAGRLDRLTPRVDAVSATARAEADDAKSAADRATVIGAAALLVGLAGVALAVQARRRPAEPAPSTAAAVNAPAGG